MKYKKYNPFSRILNNRKGVSAILIAIILPVLIGFAALAIDVGYMYTTKNELQNIADAAALAGAGELGKIYLNEVEQENHSTHTLTEIQEGQIQAAVTFVADLNEDGFSIEDSDISIGVWDWNLKQLDPPDPENGNAADAVQVIARRDNNANNPVTTFFARIFSIFGGNHDTFQVVTIATAALSGIGKVDPGVIKAPFGISENHLCNAGSLQLSPTQTSCMGWHNYIDPMNASNLSNKMFEVILGTDVDPDDLVVDGEVWLETHFEAFYTSNWFQNQIDTGISIPPLKVGDAIEVQGGVSSTLLGGDYYNTWVDIGDPQDPSQALDLMTGPVPFLTLFDYFRFRDGDELGDDLNADGTITLCDGNNYYPDEIWTTVLPIFKETVEIGCSNPTNATARTIEGFAYVQIIVPDRSDPGQLKICYDCDWVVEHGRGSGVNLSNVKGSIPSLVE
ncbi:MAG: TadE/TadG family type IV pilus assembly protein [Desulfotignum sp.]|nr:TadE/TadG family type IV pilus assembly protein [Desulfotignum sp.]